MLTAYTAHQQEVALQRVRLNYEEEEIPAEAVQAWQLMLSRPMARIDSNILHSGIKQGEHYVTYKISFCN